MRRYATLRRCSHLEQDLRQAGERELRLNNLKN